MLKWFTDLINPVDNPLKPPGRTSDITPWTAGLFVPYNESSQHKWDMRFLDIAKAVSTWSKDPSTRTGAVITNGKRIVSVGFNGFAQPVLDRQEWYENRDIKYKVILHSEENAVLFANESLAGCTLYTFPFMSCAHCSSVVLQKGIRRCVAPIMSAEHAARWKESCDLARQQFRDAGVDLLELEYR